MDKEQVLAGLRECARKAGRTPTYEEIRKSGRITRYWIHKHFVTLAHALREAGVPPEGSGHRVETAELLADWAATALKLGKLPSITEYQREGRYSIRPFFARCKRWSNIPEHFRAFVRECKTEEKWRTVLEMIEAREKLVEAAGAFWRPYPEGSKAAEAPAIDSPRARRRILRDRPFYGPRSPLSGLSYEPVNEAGVVYVFGRVADRLGIEVERIQQEFPDCEAMREVESGRWQRVRIEFEYESRNFLAHKHPADGCDLIVCWTHNWPECPENLEVVELRRVVRGM